MHELLAETSHRPWPVPDIPWIMGQTWRDLLFAHWAYAPDEVRALVPVQLELDTFDNSAWVGVVPFMLEDLHLRGLPPLPPIDSFPELNVRTYVKVDNKPGVYFFSLDAASRTAVVGARMLFHLNYYAADMSISATPGSIDYTAQRTDTRGRPARFKARYVPAGEAFTALPGTLAYFLTERYCLYAVDSSGSASRLEIHHRPWLLQPAEAELDACDMLTAAGLRPPRGLPRLHFSRVQQMIGWPPESVRPAAS